MKKENAERDLIKTPHQFATAYLSGKTKIPYTMQIEAYLDGKLKKAPIEVSYGNLDSKKKINLFLDGIVLRYKLFLKENPLLETLTTHYNKSTTRKVLIALHDLAFTLEEEKRSLEQRIKIEAGRKKLLPMIEKWIDATNMIIETPYLFEPKEKDHLSKIKNKLKEWITPKAVELGDAIFLNTPFTKEEWNDILLNTGKNNDPQYSDAWLKSIIVTLMHNPRRQRTRPYKIINGFIIAIYNLLTETPPTNIRRYKEWCKQLIADLINLSCRTNLTKKNIDNSLHTI